MVWIYFWNLNYTLEVCVFLEAGAGAQVGGLPGMCRALGSTSSTKPLNNSVMCLVVLFPFFFFLWWFYFCCCFGFICGQVWWCTSALENQKQADLSALETTLVSIVSSRLIKAIQWDPFSKTRQNKADLLDSFLFCVWLPPVCTCALRGQKSRAGIMSCSAWVLRPGLRSFGKAKSTLCISSAAPLLFVLFWDRGLTSLQLL